MSAIGVTRHRWVGWLGIDPGGRSTGLCLVAISTQPGATPRYVAHRVLTRSQDEDADAATRGVGVGPRYIGEVLDAVHGLLGAWSDHCADEFRAIPGEPGYSDVLDLSHRVAVETVVPPNPHVNRRNGRSLTDPTGVLGAAMVLGAVLAVCPHAVRVAPGGNGAGALASYPQQLVTAGELRRGLDRQAKHNTALCHARSAWDCALRGPRQAIAARFAEGGNEHLFR